MIVTVLLLVVADLFASRVVVGDWRCCYDSLLHFSCSLSGSDHDEDDGYYLYYWLGCSLVC